MSFKKFRMATFTFLTAILAATAESGAKPTLGGIDALIESKDYNAALMMASEYMKSNPQDFDRAQKRIERIMKERLSFDEKAEMLADTMKNDSENDEHKMDLILELENAETNQTEPAQELTRQARKTLALKFYIARYNSIMKSGYALVRDGDYGGATEKFREGFTLKPNDTDRTFDAEHPDGVPVVYADDITVPVAETMGRIEESLPAMTDIIERCQRSYESFMGAMKAADFAAAKKAQGGVAESFGELAKWRENLIEEVGRLKEIDKTANERNPLLAGFSYITFTLGFVTGDDNEKSTGILGTLDSFWNTRVESMKDEAYSLIRERFASIKENLPLGRIRELSPLIAEQKELASSVPVLAEIGKEIHALHSLVKTDDGREIGKLFTEYGKSLDFAVRFAGTLSKILDETEILSDEELVRDAADIEDGNFVEGDEFFRHHVGSALRYGQFLAAADKDDGYIKTEQAREDGFFAETDTSHRQRIGRTAGAQLSDDVLDFRDAIAYGQELRALNNKEADENERKLWLGLAATAGATSQSAVDDSMILITRAKTLMDGIEVKSARITNEDGEEETLTKRYPSEARTTILRLLSETEEKSGQLKEWRKLLSDGEKVRPEITNFGSGVKAFDGSIRELDGIIAESRTISSAAEKQMMRAEQALNEAKLNYEKAVGALGKEDFTEARRRLEFSRQKYTESLSLQESATIRNESDEILGALGERIVREENEFVIREVRALKDGAQDSFYEGDFEQAEKKLVRAQARWATTNTESDAEIENLLDIVRTARTMQTGRKLSPSDPLYSDMSQLLSAATQLYGEGEKLLKKGRKTDADEKLSLAQEKIRAIQQIYALNEDAALLSLRIEKLTDPKAFGENFPAKVRQAEEMKSVRERLAALENLESINPSYPGLSKKIYDLKLSIGIIRKPVTDTTKKDSDDLYNRALAIFNSAGTNQARLREATGLLDRAIALNPSNRNATRLKDRIQSRIGGTAVAVLTSNDEQMYQRAVNFFTAGNYLMADSILKTLLKNPAAQKSAKIMDLRRRVDNRL